MPVLLQRRPSVTRIAHEGPDHLAATLDRERYYREADLSAATPPTPAAPRPELPRTMLQPVTFDLDPGERLTPVALRLIDESRDEW